MPRAGQQTIHRSVNVLDEVNLTRDQNSDDDEITIIYHLSRPDRPFIRPDLSRPDSIWRKTEANELNN